MFRGESGADTEDEFVKVPFYSVGVSTGHGAWVYEEEITTRFAFRRDWLMTTFGRTGGFSCLCAVGDSMEPTIINGDLLLVDNRAIHTPPISGKIYLIRVENHLFAKRLVQDMSGNWIAKSDNLIYTEEK